MAEAILEHEPVLRLGTFLGLLAGLAWLETLIPRRRLTTSRLGRWTSNLGLSGLNALVAGVLVAATPLAAVGMAHVASSNGFGLLNLVALWPPLAVVLAIVALDLAIYVQHVLFHAIPALWRLHMVHHADLDLDVTSGARFHTLEILLSLAIKVAVVAVLGPPAVAVVLFEILLNATSMFNHSNLRLPARLDRLLRWLVVTPDMHRVHHSAAPRETNSNFGFSLPVWDRLLGTYRAQPAAGHEGMVLGIEQLRDPAYLTFPRLLLLPFRSIDSEPSTLPLLPPRTLLRLALAAAFLVTGGAKLANPDAFARSVSDFGLVPDGMLLTAAITIACLEVAAGLLLWFDRRGGLALTSGLLAAFTLVLVYGLWLGLDIDCGCLPFGTGQGLDAGLARNLVLLGCCAWLFLAARRAAVGAGGRGQA